MRTIYKTTSKRFVALALQVQHLSVSQEDWDLVIAMGILAGDLGSIQYTGASGSNQFQYRGYHGVSVALYTPGILSGVFCFASALRGVLTGATPGYMFCRIA